MEPSRLKSLRVKQDWGNLKSASARPVSPSLKVWVRELSLPSAGSQMLKSPTRNPTPSRYAGHRPAAARIRSLFSRMKQCQEISDTQNTSSRSAMSGGTPSNPDKSQRGDVREPANARQQETESMRVHRRLQAKKAERCNTGAASRRPGSQQNCTLRHSNARQSRWLPPLICI